MVKLFILNGSRHSREAEEILKGGGIDYVVIDASDASLLSRIDRDFCITQLPALVAGDSTFQGVDEIRAFVQAA